MPNSTFAKTIQPQVGANMINNGTGNPANQPATRMRLRPTRSEARPANRFASALTMPKLTRNDSAAICEANPKSAPAISGTMVRSRPTIAPTKALTTISSVNCCQLARSPKTIRLFMLPHDRIASGPPAAVTALQQHQVSITPPLQEGETHGRSIGMTTVHDDAFIVRHYWRSERQTAGIEMDRAWQMSRAPLVVVTHVEDNRCSVAFQLQAKFFRRHTGHLSCW